MSSQPSAALEYHVLGGFRLCRDGFGVPPQAWERPMAARVVRLLLVERGFMAEDRLLEAFWPDRDPVAARRSLAVAISRCRSVLGADAIVARERAYRLVLGARDTLDSDLFERAAALALDRRRGTSRAGALERAAALWHGEPLPEDRYADWAAEWREALADRYREVLAALADAHTEAGEYDAALRAARRMLASDPLDEGAHRRVMAGYAALGRRTRALDQYLRCRRELIDAVGIEPSRETTALHARILAGAELGLAA
jgi:DNA-binding SARP family transcriptional activator